LAERLGLAVTLLPGDWRHGVSAAEIEQALRADALRAALLLLRPPLFAAAMLSLHDEVELTSSRWSRRLLHRVLTGRELQRN